jgi:hypothetical protein
MKNNIYLMESRKDLSEYLKDKLNSEDSLLIYYYNDTILYFKDVKVELPTSLMMKHNKTKDVNFYIDYYIDGVNHIDNLFIEEANIFKKRDSSIYDFISHLNEIVYNYNIDMYISVNKLVLGEYKKFTRKIMNRNVTYYQLIKI